jgi:hypothetical protein
MFNPGAAGSAGNSGEGNVWRDVPAETEKSRGVLSLA